MTATTLGNEIVENYNHWTDKSFLADLNRRSEEYKSGKVKSVTWEETLNLIKSAIKNK